MLLALVLAVLLELARGHGDWGPSEGVYALTSRMILHGGDLYGGLVASQPPWVYLFGALALGIHDSLDWLRFCCGLLQVLAGAVAAGAVFRLTANRIAAIGTAGLVVVTPWATHQHGLLLPEQLGSPLLLGAAVLAARPATAQASGVVAAVAVFAKLPFALPAALLIAFSPARGVALRAAIAALVVQAAACTAIFGLEFWRQIVQAQIQAGHGSDASVGAFVQAGWTLFGLVGFALVALYLRDRSREPDLVRTLAAAAAGAVISIVTIAKPGTGLNVVVPSEPLLATLAVSGAVLAARSSARRLAVPVAAVLLALLLAQSASLLWNPTDPQPFTRPFSASAGWRVGETREEVDAAVAAARRCPPGAVYPGPQLVAFLAHRPVPGGQPDLFIVGHASRYRALYARVLAAGPRCP